MAEGQQNNYLNEAANIVAKPVLKSTEDNEASWTVDELPKAIMAAVRYRYMEYLNDNESEKTESEKTHTSSPVLTQPHTE